MEKQPITIDYHFVPFPQEIWDNNIDMTLGEFRLFGYLLRYQMRFGRGILIRLTDDELMNGKRNKEGKRVDKGCGLTSHNSLTKAKEALLKKGWITVRENFSDKARPKKWYKISSEILEKSNAEEFDNEPFEEESEVKSGVSLSDSGVSPNDSGVSSSDTRSDSKSSLSKSTLSKSTLEEKEIYKEKASPEAVNFQNLEPEKFSLDLLVPRFLGPHHLVDWYNANKPPECPRVNNRSPARIANYAKYLKDFPDPVFWAEVMKELWASEFLRGKIKTSSGVFFAKLDWLCQKGKGDRVENCVKCFEHAYSSKQKNQPIERKSNLEILDGVFGKGGNNSGNEERDDGVIDLTADQFSRVGEEPD